MGWKRPLASDGLREGRYEPVRGSQQTADRTVRRVLTDATQKSAEDRGTRDAGRNVTGHSSSRIASCLAGHGLRLR